MIQADAFTQLGDGGITEINGRAGKSLPTFAGHKTVSDAFVLEMGT